MTGKRGNTTGVVLVTSAARGLKFSSSMLPLWVNYTSGEK
jgi:hypothetical protein